MEGMQQFLWAYVNPQSHTHGAWGTSLMNAADDLEKGMTFVCKWSCAFLANHDDIPINPYGKWNESILDRDTTLAQDIHLHLQGIGPFVKAMDLVDYMDMPEMRACSGDTKQLSLLAAQCWMQKLEYRWTTNPKGQYVNRHEHDDVITYQQFVFLPAWSEIKASTRDWTSEPQPPPPPHRWTMVVWFHDESTFYANDQHVKR